MSRKLLDMASKDKDLKATQQELEKVKRQLEYTI